jgi:hypothetical protein
VSVRGSDKEKKKEKSGGVRREGATEGLNDGIWTERWVEKGVEDTQKGVERRVAMK